MDGPSETTRSRLIESFDDVIRTENLRIAMRHPTLPILFFAWAMLILRSKFVWARSVGYLAKRIGSRLGPGLGSGAQLFCLARVRIGG